MTVQQVKMEDMLFYVVMLYGLQISPLFDNCRDANIWATQEAYMEDEEYDM